jgi:hypothetical protein
MSVRKRSVAKVVGDIAWIDSKLRTKRGTTRDCEPHVGRASARYIIVIHRDASRFIDEVPSHGLSTTIRNGYNKSLNYDSFMG